MKHPTESTFTSDFFIIYASIDVNEARTCHMVLLTHARYSRRPRLSAFSHKPVPCSRGLAPLKTKTGRTATEITSGGLSTGNALRKLDSSMHWVIARPCHGGSAIRTYMMADLTTPRQDDDWDFNCVIEGENTAFVVTAGRDTKVSNLKKTIRGEREKSTLAGVDPHNLELWKVSAIDDLRCEVTSIFSAQGLQHYCYEAMQDSG